MDTPSAHEQSLWQKYKTRSAEFLRAYQSLATMAPVAYRDPILAAEYEKVMDRGKTYHSVMSSIMEKIDAAMAWASSWWSDSDAGTVQGLGSLGIAPLIPIAIIGASMAALGVWITDAWELDRKLREVERLESKGIPAGRATQMVMAERPLMQISVLAPLAIIGTLFWVMRK